MTWNLKTVLTSLHEDVQNRLGAVRDSFHHPGTMGDASETIWLDLLGTYLPKRYSVANAHVVDSNGQFSHQIDVVIFDRQYSPFILHFAGKSIIPAEAVYAVFEAKQTATAPNVRYAAKKVASVRKLHRTSLPVPHVGGTAKAKKPAPIIGGLLTLESNWSPPFGRAFDTILKSGAEGRLDMGCVAAHGYFQRGAKDAYKFVKDGKPATGFLFALISRLQRVATVPMIDVQAYAKWL
jgi:hypothetical protein